MRITDNHYKIAREDFVLFPKLSQAFLIEHWITFLGTVSLFSQMI